MADKNNFRSVFDARDRNGPPWMTRTFIVSVTDLTLFNSENLA